MDLVDLTLPTAAENVALDEALLEEAERSGQPQECLRLWEPAAPLVVIGRSSKMHEEVDCDYCDQQGIPIVRRCSGGAAIASGPGCLMYAVILSCDLRPELQMIEQAHRLVLGVLARGISPLLSGITLQGTSDLTRNGRKFSGNSLRCKRQHILYHGTLLYQFPLDLLTSCLRTPPRQPTYRAGRSHRDFVENLPLSSEELRQALIEAWDARTPRATWPFELMQELLESRYRTRAWNEQL